MPAIPELLHPDGVIFLRAGAGDAIAELCRAATHDVWQRRALERAVCEREAMATTALGCGLAVPHGHVPELDRFVMAVGIAPDGLDWITPPQGERVRLVILIGAPEGRQSGYLRLLSAVVELCSRPELRDALCACDDERAVVRLLADGAPPPDPGSGPPAR